MAISPSGLSSRLVVTLLLLCAAAPGSSAFHASQANPQTTSSAARGAISGVVTDGATGRPMAGALLSLSDTKVKVSLGTVTDSKGRFVFTDLPASPGYTFRAQKSGYYNLGLGQSDALFGLSFRIPLSENEWRQHEDVVLWPFGTIGGRVVDEQGEPVVGVPVNVLTRIAAGGSVRWVAGPTGTTDDRGVYRIDQLRRGTYVIHLSNVQSTVPSTTTPAVVAGYTPGMVLGLGRGVVPPSFGLDLGGTWLVLGQYAVPPPFEGKYRAYPPLYYAGSRSFAAAAPVDLADGEHKTGIDFVLQPASTATVSGRVVGPPDALAGLVVRLLPGDNPIENGNSELGTALVGANGTFTILGVPEGSYTLSAAPSTGEPQTRGATSLGTPGLMPPTGFTVFLSSGFLSSTPTGGTPYFGRTSVAVGAQDVTDVVLELSAAATISGRVVNQDGSPLRDLVRVSLSGTGDPTFMESSAQVVPEAGPATWFRSDPGPAAAPGRFVVRGLLEGDYLLNAGSMTSPSLVVKSIIGPDGDYTDRPFHAIPGTEISDVIITITDRPAALKGVVRDRDGAIVTQSAVILFPAERSRRSHFGLSPSRIKSAAAVGRDGYTLSRLRAGDYLVVATDVSQSSAWQDSRFLEAAAAIATPVTLTWGASTVLNLTLRQVIVR